MRQKGFLAIEYSVFIAVLVAALIGMAIYLKRGIMAKWRDGADAFGYGRQYEPGVTKCYDGAGNEIPCN